MFQVRYSCFLRVTAKSTEAQSYTSWVGKQLASWARARGRAMHDRMTEQDHAEFDTWLLQQFPTN